jgi:hypothetical protein
MHNDDWEEVFYEKIFDAVCQLIAERKKRDSEFTKDELERQLEHLCILEGQDQGGRGPVGDLDLAATIAAMQHMLAEWREN